MTDPKQTNREPVPAETARPEGTQGHTGQSSADRTGDGAVDAGDPKLAEDVTEVAEQVHANA
jgi:hypothetical protein